jgi:hypothetical protein
VTVTKQRDLKKVTGLAFKLVTKVVGENHRGKEVTSCVVEATAIRPKLTEIEEHALGILKTLADRCGVRLLQRPVRRQRRRPTRAHSVRSRRAKSWSRWNRPSRLLPARSDRWADIPGTRLPRLRPQEPVRQTRCR